MQNIDDKYVTRIFKGKKAGIRRPENYFCKIN